MHSIPAAAIVNQGRGKQGRGSGEPQPRESTNPGGMESWEGARESPNPVREGEGGREISVAICLQETLKRVSLSEEGLAMATE